MSRKIRTGRKSSALAGESWECLRADMRYVEHLEMQ